MRRALVLAAVIFVVVSAVPVPGAVGGVAPVEPASAVPQGFQQVPAQNFVRRPQTVDERAPPQAALGPPQGNPGLQGPVAEVPAQAANYAFASAGADTLTLEWATTNFGHLALVATDDANHEGREIAVLADVFERAVGYRPGLAWGTFENGTEWRSVVEYDESGSQTYAVFEIPAFSTNTITWSGQFTIEATPATNGSTYTYTQENTAGNYTINVTGVVSDETDSDTGSAVDINGSASFTVAGNQAPTGATLELTGNHEQYDIPQGTSLIGDHSGSFDADMGYVDRARFCLKNRDEDDPQFFDAWVNVSGNQHYVFQNAHFDDGQIRCNTAWINETHDYGAIEYGTHDDGSSRTDIEAGSWVRGWPKTQNATIDSTTYEFGNFTDGATTTSKSVTLTQSSSSINFQGVNESAGTLDWNLTYTEHELTEDPTVEVNKASNSTSHTGTLAEGNEVGLTTNTDWVRTGGAENTVTVTVGADNTADDPTPSVDLYYTHDGEDDTDVDYTGEKWQETYNVSKTYAQDQLIANLTIPFVGSVVRIRSVENKTNSGSFTSVPSSAYTLDGTTLTVELGTVSKDDTEYVKVTGSKVSPNNASITVTQATAGGVALATDVTLDSWNSDSFIAFDQTEDGDRIHYTTSESWSNPAEYNVFKSAGARRLYLDAASDGDTLTVNNIALEAVPQSGEVRLEVTDTDPDEPQWQVKPNGSATDAVDYTFINAKSGMRYELRNVDTGDVRDFGTAESPLTLTDAEDNEETLIFAESSSGSGGGGGGGGGGGAGPVIQEATGAAAAFVQGPLMLVAAPLVILGLYWFVRRYGTLGPDSVRIRIPFTSRSFSLPIPGGAVTFGIVAVVGILAFENVSGGAISTAIARAVENALNQVLPLLLLAGGGALIYLLLRDRGGDSGSDQREVVVRVEDRRGGGD